MNAKLELSAQDQKIADLANELMNIPIGWIDDPRTIDPDAIRLFQQKFSGFLESFGKRQELIDAAVVVSAMIRTSTAPPAGKLPLSSLDGRVTPNSYARLLKDVQKTFQPSSELASRERLIDIYLDTFLEAERKILLSVDLNQQTAQIILSRLAARRHSITTNLLKQNVISRSKWERSLDAAQRLSSYVRLTARTRQQYDRAPILTRLKDRAAGITAIWADLTTLFCGQDLDVATFVSTIAGATISTILPGQPK